MTKMVTFALQPTMVNMLSDRHCDSVPVERHRPHSDPVALLAVLELDLLDESFGNSSSNRGQKSVYCSNRWLL